MTDKKDDETQDKDKYCVHISSLPGARRRLLLANKLRFPHNFFSACGPFTPTSEIVLKYNIIIWNSLRRQGKNFSPFASREKGIINLGPQTASPVRAL